MCGKHIRTRRHRSADRFFGEQTEPARGGLLEQRLGSRQRIQPGDLLGVRVRDVRRLSEDAARTITGLGDLCHARRAESTRLATMRDSLLPLLISGRIRVRPQGM